MDKSVVPNTLCMVYKDRIEILSGSQIDKEKVGAKAYGLATIPYSWTLPFFVISSEMFDMYASGQNIETLEEVWYGNILKAMHTMNFDLSQDLFLRSNMCSEDLIERGQFESYDCSIEKLITTIKVFFDRALSSHVAETTVPILVQQYVQAIGKGHISNERRLSKEHRDWKGEIERKNWNGTLSSLEDTFSISLRNWRRKVVVDEANIYLLSCSSLKNIAQVLELPCAWATNRNLRIHFEWIYDGKHVYIVQADTEQDYGVNPFERADSSRHHFKGNVFSPQVLYVLSSDDKDKYLHYTKICNPLLYNELGLKTAPIYILENNNEIEALLNDKISDNLVSDISALVASPLVIRTDIDTEEQAQRQMLPRTDDIRNTDDAVNWLRRTAKELRDKYNGEFPFIFIFHNFIPAFSSAFAYAEPNNRNVLVESLWGVPEGLYYYTHDKHIVDTKQQDFAKVVASEISVIQKKIFPKTNFICPEADGTWKYNPVSNDYIWKQAIPKESWLREIAISTRKISENIGAGVSVMWFVGVNPKKYGCNVFPWYHERFTYDFVPKQTNRKKHRSDTGFTISQNTDIEKLKRIVQYGNRENIKYLLLKPIEESLIRNKDIIEEVGKMANAIGAVVTLEGGVLSHAYYQLKRTGVAVEVRNPFDYSVANIEYDKLVRDKIPDKIVSSGEIAFTKKLSDNEFFEQLRLKLVEEAFEVLEADNIDDLIQELADVLEVIDSIVHKQNIQNEAIIAAKTRKKEKIGGFESGILLQKTALPIYKSIREVEEESSLQNTPVTTWVDKKEKTDYNEIIKRLRIPVSLKQWDTHITAKGLNKRPDIHVSIKGKRINSSLQIEVSISERLFEQLTLFDN